MKRHLHATRIGILPATLLTVALTSGCGQRLAEPVHGKDREQDHTATSIAVDEATFRAWATTFVANPHADVLLSDARKWFGEHFEPALAENLASEYLERAKEMDQLPKVIEKVKAKGQTEILVTRSSAAIDMNASGLQNAALQRMTTRVDLYTLHLVEAGKDTGDSFRSFVYEGGTFKFVGKMPALNPTRGDLVADVLCNLTLAKAEKLMHGNGMLTGSAVDYLKDKKILK